MEQDKYVLTVSCENDKSTDEVIKYLLYYGVKYIRINESEVVKDIKIIISNDVIDFCFLSGKKNIHYSKIISLLYRRGRLNFQLLDPQTKPINEAMRDIKYKAFFEMYKREFQSIVDLNEYLLSKKRHINLPSDNHLSKMTVLSVASSFGLNTPRSIVIQNIPDLSIKNKIILAIIK